MNSSMNSCVNISDQWLATGRQTGASNWALLWSFQAGNPIGTVNRATTAKPTLGNPEPKLEDPKLRVGDPKPKPRLGDPKPRLGAPNLGLGTPSLGLGTPSLGLGTLCLGVGTPSLRLESAWGPQAWALGSQALAWARLPG